MTTKELLEKMIKDVADMRQEISLLREDFDSLNIEVNALKQEMELTKKNDNNAKEDLRQQIQTANDRIVAKVETKVESIEDMIEDRKVVHYKKPWFNWFKKKR